MAVTATVFAPAAASLLRGQVGDVQVAGVLKALLLTSTYVKNPDHRFRSELTGEVVHASYPAGGVALTNVVVSYDPLTNTTMLDCDDITFPNLTATMRYVVFYREQTTTDLNGLVISDPPRSPLLVLWDLGVDESSAAAPYVLTIAAEGLLRQVVT